MKTIRGIDRVNRPVAVVYARVSSKEQEKGGFSIPAQRKLLMEYAATSGLSVVREFVDIETAKQSGRTRFGEMLAFLRNNAQCRVVLVEKTDRLYRNIKDWVTLEELGLEIHLVKENVVLTRDSRSSEKFMHGIKVLMAKNYIDNLSEETKKGMLEKAAQGIWPSYAPLGYRNVLGANGKRSIEIDPQVAPIISRVFEWYATGRLSIRDVAKLARREGLLFRKSKSPVPTSIIHRILRSRIYTGNFDFMGKTYEGVHDAIISHELWETAQGLLDGRSRGGGRKSKRDFAFSGLISCGHCGCSMVGEVKKQRYVYYHCTGHKGRCPEPYTREEILEEHFSELLKGLAFDDEVLGWLSQALQETQADNNRHREQAISRLRAEHARLQNRIDTMYVDKLDGRIDVSFFDRMSAEWRSEQSRLLRSIQEHESASTAFEADGVRLLELSSKAHELFEMQAPGEKRRLLNFVFSNCSWKGGELRAEYKQPFDLLAVTTATYQAKKAAGCQSTGLSENWLLR